MRGEIHGSNSGSVINWIIANDFPDSVRVLCHNCNQALGFYGFCPHDGGELWP